MKTIDRAEAIQKVMEIRNAADALLDILLPEELPDGCPHPAESVEDRSTMDEDGALYHCLKCGAESKTPFASIHHEG
jgi:hypothetical protein